MEQASGQLGWDQKRLAAPHEQVDKAVLVRHMFDSVARRYELLNRVFSAGRDAAWRRQAVDRVRAGAEDAVLDVACGTGDFLRTFAALPDPPRRLVGCDFSHGMLREAMTRRSDDRFQWIEADALRLPFAAASFTVASCAFGVRNFQDLDAGLCEMGRVLKPNGRIIILEFTRPANRLFRALYEFYAERIMPWAATWLSGDRTGAYRYLPRSVVSFVGPEEMGGRLKRAGFGAVTATPRSLGIVTLYVGTKANAPHG